MYTYAVVKTEIIPGSLEDFRALMHEIYELQHEKSEDRVFLQGERTSPDYPPKKGRWEVTLGGSLKRRGYIIARQLPDQNTQLQFAYYSKFQPIGVQFEKDFFDHIMRKITSVNEKVDVLIVTVTKAESQAVIKVFSEDTGHEVKPVPISEQVYHDLGVINGLKVFMVQSAMGSGGLGASLQTVQKGISLLSPKTIIMVGIAFGINRESQSIGDILVSQRLMSYESQRIGPGGTIPRGDRVHATPRLIQLFRSSDLYWDESKARIHFGLILSGEKLVDNKEFLHKLRELEPEAIGGEMEGAGLYVACQDAKVDWILVKSICDWADGRKAENKRRNQRLAASNAASFVLHTLRHTEESKNTGELLPRIELHNRYLDEESLEKDGLIMELTVKIQNGNQDIESFEVELDFPNLDVIVHPYEGRVIGEVISTESDHWKTTQNDKYRRVVYSSQSRLYPNQEREIMKLRYRSFFPANGLRGLRDLAVSWHLYISNMLPQEGSKSWYKLWKESL